MNPLLEMFSYPFIIRACLVGLLISIISALIGISIVLRKNSMLGDGLAHVAFGAFAIATVLNLTPIWFALPIVILSSFFILHLKDNRHISGDSAVAILSASSLAIGTFAISIGQGVNVDLNSYLFGSILSVSWLDVIMSLTLFLVTIALYIFAYHRIFAITFDENFAKSIGIKTNLYDIIFAIICSLVIVLGMRLLGALLISSLIIFPTLIAMHLVKTFRGVVLVSILTSCITFLTGLVLSYLLSAPTGATIVLVNLIVFIFVKLYSLI